LAAIHYARQDRVAEHEAPSAGYTLANTGIAYRMASGGAMDWEVFWMDAT
jgi:hypothetical protein